MLRFSTTRRPTTSRPPTATTRLANPVTRIRRTARRPDARAEPSGANPGRILTEVRVDLERPRDRRAPAFEALVDQLYGLLTGRETVEAVAEHVAVTPI